MTGPHPVSPMAALARRHDPDRFLCALFAPAAARETLFTLIALNHELARAREAAREPVMVLIRLQWWRDAVEEAASGRPARRHEVAGPLSEAIREGRLDADALLAMIEAREAGEPPENLPAFRAALAGTAGAMAGETGRVLGVPAAFAAPLARGGEAYGLAGTLRSLPILLASGRRPLPEALLPEGASPDDPAMAARLREAAATELEVLTPALRALRDLPRAAVAAALPAVLARRDLRALCVPGRSWTAAPAPRGAGDRIAVTWAGLRGRV